MSQETISVCVCSRMCLSECVLGFITSTRCVCQNSITATAQDIKLSSSLSIILDDSLVRILKIKVIFKIRGIFC